MKRILGTGLLVFACASAAAAQTVTITAPAIGARLKAGDDFASRALGDPWDMSNAEDVSLNPADSFGFQSGFGITDGAWNGATTGPAGLMLYSPGLDAPAIPITREGRLVPIGTPVYRKLVFKASTNISGQTIGVHWFFGNAGQASSSGYALSPQKTVVGTAVYSIDFVTNYFAGQPWLGEGLQTARGLRLIPSEERTAGLTFQLDWVRLTRADNHPMTVATTVSWTSRGSDNVTVDVIDDLGDLVQTVANGTGAAAGSALWLYGGLLPGSYTLRIYHSTAGAGNAATRAVVINAPPTIQITSPAPTSGPDYPTLVRSNPWDFNSAADVRSTQRISAITYDGALNGTTDPAPSGQLTADPQVWLLSDETGAPIDASRYHWLTFGLKFDEGTPASATTRLLFGSTLNRPDLLTATQDIAVWSEGDAAPTRSYTIDLRKLRSGSGLVPGGTGPATWAGFINQLRFDPSEFPEASTFHLDDVKLTADPVSSDGTFSISWSSTSDPSGPAPTVSLAFSPVLDATNPTGIVSGVAASDGGYVWNTRGVANGTYYVRAVISDGLDSSISWSPVPVVVMVSDTDADQLPDSWELFYGLDPTSAAGSNGANGDPDGDGFTNLQEFLRGSHPTRTRTWPHLLDLNNDRGGDVFLYNRTTGERRFELTNRLTTGFTQGTGFWDPGWQIHPANLDGDEYTDFFLYDPARGLWVQARNHAGDGTFTYSIGSWDSSWRVMPSDLDGDGLTDLFVYNAATGVWVQCVVDGSGGFAGYTAGTWDPGWTLTTADLNGDGRADFFLYNRATGVWVEAFTQAGGGFDYPASGQWDPGWQVVRGDVNGDGRTDLFLLNPAGVHVTALSRAGGGFDYVGGAPWAPGWSVAPGDLNNDGTTDLFLYNVANGVWVEAFSDGAGDFTYASGQWDPGWAVAVTDFNEDGRGDLMLTRGDGTWVRATNIGAGTFAYAAGNWGSGWTVYTQKAD